MVFKVALVLITALFLETSGAETGLDGYDEEIPSTHVPRLLSDAVIMEVTMGESVTFPCAVDNLAGYVLIWKTGKKQNNAILFAVPLQVLRDNRYSIVEETSLHISRVQPKDSGEYICQISSTPPVELTHTLNVLYPPTVKPRPVSGEVTAKEGEKVTLACDATGNPEPRISWKHAGRHYESANGKAFVLNGVQKSDSGEYECIADNGVGDVATAILTVNVVSAPKITAQPADGVVTVNEGESVSLSCEATGEPTPNITWKKPGSDKLHRGENNGEIVIPGANRSHAGTYECIAANSMGISTSFEIKVQVLYAPEIQVPVPWLHTGEGSTVNLTCIVHGEPLPSVTWKHDDKALVSNGHHHVKTMGHSHILQIHHIKEDDFGQYECSAQNTLSTTSAFIDVAGTPKIPSFKSKPHGSQETKHTLQWTAESHSPIDEYSLRYKKKSGGDWIVVNVESNGEKDGHLNTQSSQLTDLEPGTIYEAVVKAHNKFGWSNDSDNFEFKTKGEVVATTMTKKPTVAAAVVEGSVPYSNGKSQDDGGSDRGCSCHICSLAIVAQVVALCILRPLLL